MLIFCWLMASKLKFLCNYLGMSICVGKNKCDVFSFLSERVGHKLQGRANKNLSKAGKLTLLKSIAQTIPKF